MRSIHVSVGHDDEFVVAQFGRVKSALIALIVAHTGTKGSNHGLNLLILEHLGNVVHLSFHVQNFSAQR